MTKPTQTTKSAVLETRDGAHDTTSRNAVMDTHSMIFVIIDKPVFSIEFVNVDPLDDFPDHWQPRFSVSFPFAGK